MPLVLRSEKGSQLTFNEMDGNFTYLEELSQTGSFTGSFIGDGSGLTNIPGVTPIATGSFATTGSNIFVSNQTISGSLTMSGSISQVGVGTNNTFVGNSAGIARTTGINNTLIGNRAGQYLNAGNFNTFIGRSAGNQTTNGTANTAIGADSLFSNSGGLYNTAIGNNALSTAINSSYNIAIGESAAIVTGDSQIVSNPANSIFIGALTKPQGVSNTNTIVIGYGAIGNGDNTVTLGNDSVTATYLRGAVTITGSIQLTGSANINGSITQGLHTLASGKLSRAYGLASTASGEYSHAEGGIFGLGDSTIYKGGTASGTGSHAEGSETIAFGIASHAEGFGSWAIGNYSHAEGSYTTASGDYSHAEGFATFASSGAHSEGENTRAGGNFSHAEGYYTTASGNYSHAEGLGTIASGSYSHAQGAYNIAIPSPSSFIIGNGVSNGSRSNLVFASGSQFQVTGSLLVSGSAILTGGITGSSFTGSFVGDGSGLTGIPGVTPIATGSFATTGSNQFNGGQSISGSVTISGSVNATGNSTFGRNSASRQQFIGSIAVGPAFEVDSPLLPNTASFFSIAVGASNKVENYSIAVGELLHSPSGQSNNALFGAFHSASNTGQTIVGIASKIEDTGVGAFVVGNGTDVDNRSNLLVAQGSTVQVTGSLLVTGSANIRGNQTLTSGSLIVTGSSLFISPSYGNGIGANNSGSKFTQNTTTVSMVIKPSGSFNYGNISVSDNNDGNSTVNLYGSTLLIGNTSANSILFGNASSNTNLLGTYNFRAGINVTGSLLVTGSANINGFMTYPQVSASLNFADDTAAASGGVPLGGIYRSGSFVLIRLV